MTLGGAPTPGTRPASRRRASISTFLASLGNIGVLAAQSIVLTPLYLRRMGDHLFGAWLGSGDVLVWMQAFDFGLPNLLIQRVGAADARGDGAEVGRWLANGALALTLIATLIGIAGAAVAGQLPRIFGVAGAEGGELSRAFLFSSVATAVAVLNNGAVGYARGIQRTGLVNAAMVAASIAGFVTSLVLVAAGFRLMAIAWGMVARSAVLVAGSALFLARELTPGVRAGLRLDRRTMREFARILPATAIGGLSYAAMNQSELALVALVLNPERAAMFMVTKRASELVKALADAVSFSSYGAFAHLVTSGERALSGRVYAEIVSLRTSIAVALAAAFIAANPAFVTAWVGEGHFAGLAVSALVGVQSVITGGAYLTNYLFRAAGGVVKGSLALAVEAVMRVALSVGLIRAIGLAGIPVAASATGLAFGYLAHRWTIGAISPFSERSPRTSGTVWATRAGLLVAACLVSRVSLPAGWLAPLATGGAFAVAGMAALLTVDMRARAVMRSTGMTLAAAARGR